MTQEPNYAGPFEQFIAENLWASLLFALACIVVTAWGFRALGDWMFRDRKKRE